uniref:peptidylprolyl isomerase n=1 Tax=Bursaphelenchus xylophilus TaxID=6326 RepID=A0A1I7SBB5_BURXY
MSRNDVKFQLFNFKNKMSKDRRRCFFDIAIDGELAGRIVIELYDDICPETCENFCQLCVGESGIGKTTGKTLHYKGSIIHRVVKNFMIQGGDFTNGNGTGGESIYGGVFEDENFIVKHDQPFIVSMANRGPNTNGSQFFITTNTTPHLDDVHVAFGRVVQGQDVVTKIENLKTGPKNRPVSDVVIANCGQLIKKKKENEESDSESVKEKKKKKEKKDKKKRKRSHSKSPEKEATPELPEDISTVRPEDLPEEPVTNKWLLRNTSPKNGKDTKSDREKRDRDRSSRRDRDRRGRDRSPRARVDRQGLKVRGRGRLCYRSLSRDGSATPPHWKKEESRLITIDELKKKQEEREKQEQEEEEAQVHNYGYRASPPIGRPSSRQDRRERNGLGDRRRSDDVHQEYPRKRPEIVFDRERSPRRETRREKDQEREREPREDRENRHRDERDRHGERERRDERGDHHRDERKRGDLRDQGDGDKQRDGDGHQKTLPYTPVEPTINVNPLETDLSNIKRKPIMPPAELPSTYIIETEPMIQPETNWAKDHGKRARREHKVIEKERIDPKEHVEKNGDKRREAESPPRKLR